MTRPLLLLDVDGVLCPTFRQPLSPGQQLVEVDESDTVVMDAQMTGRLKRLGASYDLVWCTSWEERANEYIAPLYQLPALPTISFDTDARATWKLPAVERFVGQRPFAWIDDELQPDAHAWAAERLVPTLLIDVDPRDGLTDRLVDLLVEFAADVN